jgi:hypothetical protein
MPLADLIIADLFSSLKKRKGWDEFWSTISPENKMEILGELRISINERLGE